MPLNSIRAAVDAGIELVPKMLQVLWRDALGTEQLPTWVAPTSTRPLLKLANVVPFGNVTSIVLMPVADSPPVGDVVKVTMYCVVADWAELPGVAVTLVSGCAVRTV